MINFNRFKHKPESVLIISLPILMIFSRFFLEISLLFISFSFLYILIKNKNLSKIFNFFTYVFFIFYFILLISYLLSDFKSETFTIFFYFRFCLYVLALSFFFNNDDYLVNFFFKTIVLVVIALLIDAMIQFVFGKNILNYKNEIPYRVTSFFNDEQILGSFVSKIFIFLLLAKVFFKRSLIKTHFLINFSIICSPIIIFLSGERASILIFSIMCIYLSFFLYRENRFKIFYRLSFILIFVLSVLLLNSKTYYDRYVSHTLSGFFDPNSAQNQDQLPKDIKTKYKIFFLSAEHQSYMMTSLNIFKEKKFTGSGPKSYRYACKEENMSVSLTSCNSHPHNYYLQILSETGFLGTVFLVFIYLMIVYRSIINFFRVFFKKNYDLFEIITLAFYFSQFWPINQTGNLFNNFNSIMLFFPMGIYLYLKDRRLKKLI